MADIHKWCPKQVTPRFLGRTRLQTAGRLAEEKLDARFHTSENKQIVIVKYRYSRSGSQTKRLQDDSSLSLSMQPRAFQVDVKEGRTPT
jgi:hypothetical protein